MIRTISERLSQGRSLRGSRGREARAPLRCGPWLWPTATNGLEAAKAVSGLRGPRDAAPGNALCVSVTADGSCGELWLILSARSRQVETVHSAPPDRQMCASWRDARQALQRNVPLLRGERAGIAVPDLLHRLECVVMRTAGDWPGSLVATGRSAGLAFVLAQASFELDRPLPEDIIASAKVDPDGRVRPVAEGSLDAKVETICRAAPRIRRLFVASDQADQAKASANGRLKIVGVETVEEAIDKAWANDFTAFIRSEGADGWRAKALTSRLVDLVLFDAADVTSWRPVHRAAAIALEEWTNADADTTKRLELVTEIAERHESNEGTIDINAALELFADRREKLRVIAHWVQQHVDAGLHDLERARHLVEDYCPNFETRETDALAILGAWARVQAISGQERAAIKLARRVAESFVGADRGSESSHALCEWLRLAGALDRPDEQADAERFIDRIEHDLDDSSSYVAAARGITSLRIALRAGRSLDDETRRNLADIVDDEHAAHHIRTCAARWLTRAGEDQRAWLDEQACALDHDRVRMAETSIALVDLDDALGTADQQRIQRCLARVAALDPGPVAALREATPEGRDESTYVAELYPY